MSLKNLPCLTLGPHATASDRVQPASDRVQPEKTSPAMAEKKKEKTKTADETKPIRNLIESGTSSVSMAKKSIPVVHQMVLL